MTIDYAAIAEKYGGTTTPPPTTPASGTPIDYNAIASKLGGTNVPAATKPIIPAAKPTAQSTPALLTQDQEKQNFINTPKTVDDLAVGAGKGVINVAKDSSDLVNKIASHIPSELHDSIKQMADTNPALATLSAALQGVGKISPAISSLEKNVGAKPNSLVTPNNTNQQVGKFLGEAGAAAFPAEEVVGGGAQIVEKLLPKGESLAEKALSLTNDELQSVDKSKLKYLGTKGLDMVETKGGLFREKSFKMPEQVKQLSDEFSHVLTSKNPEKNIKNVISEMGVLQEKSKAAFDGANKIINKEQLSTGIRKAISDISDTAYESMSKEGQSAYSEKRISDFLSHVKEGTLKGLDDALESFRAKNAKGDATISNATDATYQAVKKYIVENLPKENADLYKAANKQQAKLFDVAEILKGKVKASVGTYGKLGKLLKTTGIGAGSFGAGEILKKVITGKF